MPIQMLPKEGSFGQTLGSSLGQGISTGLQALAQQKMNRMKSMSDLGSLIDQAKYVGVSPDYLQLISNTAKSNPELAQKQLASAIKFGEKGKEDPSLWQKIFGGKKAVSPYVGSNIFNQQDMADLRNFQSGSQDMPNLDHLPNERREELREKILDSQGGKSLLEILGGIPVNLLSGLTQGVGSLGGISGLLNSTVGSALNSLIEAPSFEQKMLKRDLASLDPSSKEYENVKNKIDAISERKSAAKLKGLPESEDIKENVVRPVASALGLEKLITNPDFFSKVAERVGNVSPLLGLSAIASGGPMASRLLSSAVTSIGSEGVGELSKRISGPVADSVFTMLGYLTGGFRPGKIKNIINGGYKAFDKLVSSSPNAVLNAEPLNEVLDKVGNNLVVSDKGSKFIKNRVADIAKKIRTVTEENAKSFKIPRSSISAKEAFLLDKELGGDTFEAAKEIGEKAASRLTELREGLRNIYQPYYSKIDPKATQELISARNLKRSMHARDVVQKFLEDNTKGKTGFFNKFLFAARKAGGAGAEIRKYTKLFTEVPEFRRAFFNILQEGAKQNAGGTIKEINKLNKLARDKKIK